MISDLLNRLEMLLQLQLYGKAWGMHHLPSLSAYGIIVQLCNCREELAVYMMLLRSLRTFFSVHSGAAFRNVVRRACCPSELQEIVFQTWLVLRSAFGHDVAFKIVDKVFQPEEDQLERAGAALIRTCAYLNRFWVPRHGLPWGEHLLHNCYPPARVPPALFY